MIDLLERFPGTSVLVVGDVMLDEYIWGEVRRVSPEAPVPVVEVRARTYVPGGAANVASGVAGLGGKARLAGVVGDDRGADLLRETLVDAGVEAGLTLDASRPTTTKTRIVAQSQQVVRADSEDRSPVAPEVADEVVSWIADRIAETDALLSDYAKGVVSAELAQRVIGLAGESGTPVVADPKGSDYAKYRDATVVTPNIHEAKRAAGLDGDAHHDLSEVSGRLAEILGDSALLITRGAQGMSLFPNGAEATVDIPSRARNVFDVTGAGDAVVSTLALGLGCGAPLEDAARLANAAAGVAVGRGRNADGCPWRSCARPRRRSRRPTTVICGLIPGRRPLERPRQADVVLGVFDPRTGRRDRMRNVPFPGHMIGIDTGKAQAPGRRGLGG